MGGHGPGRSGLGGDLAELARSDRSAAEPQAPAQAQSSRLHWVRRWQARARRRAATTGSGLWITRVVNAVVILALVAGPAALAGRLLEPTSRTGPAPASADAHADRSATVTQAEELAVRVTWAWARTTGSHDELASFGLSMTGAPQQPLPVTSVRPAGVSVQSADPLEVAVTVAADVDGAGTRYLLVASRVSAAGAAALSLPAPAPAPPAPPAPARGYQQVDLTVSSPLGAAVSAFLAAYVAGVDVTRYTSPGSVVAVPAPGQWTLKQVPQISASGQPETALTTAAPQEGATASVLARYLVSDQSGPRASESALQMRVRSGRWEVAAVVAAPVLDEHPGPVTATPSGSTHPGTSSPPTSSPSPTQ